MKKNSLINVGFSLILFLMFVAGSFFLLYYGANSYKKSLEKTRIKEGVEIPFAYITTRIRQASSFVSVDTIDDRNILVIENANSYTLIYYMDSYLYELMISDYNDINLKGGTKIYSVDNFNVEYKDNLYVITVNDEQFKIGARQ